MAKKGYIYKGLKPVYWCTHCHTALAEAEIEYAEDELRFHLRPFKFHRSSPTASGKAGIPMDKPVGRHLDDHPWTCPPTRHLPERRTLNSAVRQDRR